MRGPGHLAWVVGGLVALGLWVALRSCGPCDDEYIVWRYARNLATGQGLCFNRYSHVEGFTCPLWVLALAFGMLLSIPPLVASSACALVSALVASAAPLLARGRERRESDAWCAIAIACSVPLAYHAAQGLGTAAAAALVALWYVALRREHGGFAGVFLGAATLLRPELLVLLPFHAFAARSARAWIAAAVLPLGWLLLRRESFGEWLPMTYFVKKLPLVEDLRYGVAYLGQATIETGIGLLLLLLLAARLSGRALRARTQTAALFGALATTAGVVFVGGDYMFLARFLVPLVPLVLLLCADALGEFEGARRVLVRCAWVALLALQAWPILRIGELRLSQQFYEQRWIAIGRELAAHAPPHYKLATSPIGAIGWHSNLPIVDMLGITNGALRSVQPDLAVTLKGHQRHDARWVLEQRPDGIVLGNGISPRGERSLDVNAWEKELYQDEHFQALYEPRLFPIPGSTSLIYFQRLSGQRLPGSRPLGDPGASAPFEWPVPPGWKSETLRFPLEFAPELPWRGVEELRFMPGFSSAAARDFWSYTFVWWLEDTPKFDAEVIAPALRDYFRGLSLAVGREKYSFETKRFRVELTPRSAGAGEVLAGQVWTYDPFATGQELVLQVEVRIQRCPRAGRNALVFLVSPRSPEDPLWAELRACAAAFDCAH